MQWARSLAICLVMWWTMFWFKTYSHLAPITICSAGLTQSFGELDIRRFGRWQSLFSSFQALVDHCGVACGSFLVTDFACESDCRKHPGNGGKIWGRTVVADIGYYSWCRSTQLCMSGPDIFEWVLIVICYIAFVVSNHHVLTAGLVVSHQCQDIATYRWWSLLLTMCWPFLWSLVTPCNWWSYPQIPLETNTFAIDGSKHACQAVSP